MASVRILKKRMLMMVLGIMIGHACMSAFAQAQESSSLDPKLAPADYGVKKRQIQDKAERLRRSQLIQDVSSTYREMVASFKARRIEHGEELVQKLDGLLDDPLLPQNFSGRIRIKQQNFLTRIYGRDVELAADFPVDKIADEELPAIRQRMPSGKTLEDVLPEHAAAIQDAEKPQEDVKATKRAEKARFKKEKKEKAEKQAADKKALAAKAAADALVAAKTAETITVPASAKKKARFKKEKKEKAEKQAVDIKALDAKVVAAESLAVEAGKTAGRTVPVPDVQGVAQSRKEHEKDLQAVLSQREQAQKDLEKYSQELKGGQKDDALTEVQSRALGLRQEKIDNFLKKYRSEIMVRRKDLQTQFDLRIEELYRDGVEFYESHAYRTAWDLLSEVEKLNPGYKDTRHILDAMRIYVDDELTHERRGEISDLLDQYQQNVQ